MKFQLPLPPRGCSSNGPHGQWYEASAARKVYRQECWIDATVQRIALLSAPVESERRRVSLRFCTKGVRKEGRYAPRDEANGVAAAKGLFDGLVDAGWLVDDSAKWMQLGAVTIDNKRGPWVEVTIEEAS